MGTSRQIAPPTGAGDVVDVDMRSGTDIDGRAADWAAVLDDLATRGNRLQRHFVAARNALRDGNHLAADVYARAGYQIFERGCDVVCRTDDQDGGHLSALLNPAGPHRRHPITLENA